jgi:hypothetical protein
LRCYPYFCRFLEGMVVSSVNQNRHFTLFFFHNFECKCLQRLECLFRNISCN